MIPDAELAAKYDAIGEKYSSRYRDPEWWSRRQAALVLRWGTPLSPGDSVFEFGCADGRLVENLAVAGCRVGAVDLSSKMISLARARLGARNLAGDLRTGPMDEHVFEAPVDAVVALMANFFDYSRDPRATLKKFHAAARKKLLVDLNPRTFSLRKGLALLREAGFARVAWRPFFVPQRVGVGPLGRAALAAAEATPVVNALLLRRKFSVVLKGEK